MRLPVYVGRKNKERSVERQRVRAQELREQALRDNGAPISITKNTYNRRNPTVPTYRKSHISRPMAWEGQGAQHPS